MSPGEHPADARDGRLAAAPTGRPPVAPTGRPPVAILFPADPHPSVSEALDPVAEVRVVGWSDGSDVRRAKTAGSRTPAWIRAHEPPLDEAQRAMLADAVAVLALDLPLSIADLAPRLALVQGIGAGVGQLIAVCTQPEIRRRGVRLCSAAGMSGDKIAEFVMARLLAVWTDLRTLDALQRARRWAPDEVAATRVAGRTMVVVGTGGIGREIATRAAAFGVTVVGVRRRPALGAPPGFARVVGPDDLRGALAGADAVVVAAPATARTQGLVGAGELDALAPGAVLVNVARGSLVDEEAVVAALGSGHLGAAVLDVFAHEPLSRRSPLWDAPGAYLSPHVANAWRPEYQGRVARLFAENLANLLAGRPLRNEVDLAEGY